MPAIMAIVLLLMGFQLFFRYDSWPSDKYEGVIYERDTLTGAIRTIRPGEQIDFTRRLLGDNLANQLASANRPPNFEEAFNFSMIDVSNQTTQGVENNTTLPATPPDNTITKVIEAPKQTANTGAPVPQPATSAGSGIGKFSTHNLDLNNDGETEQIIQRITANDGLVDISIVRHGREIFYGRGKQLQVLNTRHDGWLDVALNTGEPQSPVYKFNVSLDGYSPNAVQTAKR